MTDRSFDHKLDLAIRHSHNHRHTLPGARKLQHVKYLVTLLPTHLHNYTNNIVLLGDIRHTNPDKYPSLEGADHTALSGIVAYSHLPDGINVYGSKGREFEGSHLTNLTINPNPNSHL